MTYRFNVPPGWPVAPGWAPPPNWQAPPEWPTAPSGWQWWVPETVPQTAHMPQSASTATQVNPDLQMLLSTPVASVSVSAGIGLGRKGRLEHQLTAVEDFACRLQRALVTTVGELRALGALEASELTVEIDERRARIEHLDAEAAARKASIEAQAQDQLHQIGLKATAANTELHRLNLEVAKAKEALVVTRDEALLQ